MKSHRIEHKIAFLKEVAPFSVLTDNDLQRIAQNFIIKKFTHRGTIFYQGDTSSDICVIRTGKVRVITVNESGEESCLRILAEKDILGELSACDGAPRCASAQAIGTCAILMMRHRDFVEYLRTIPELSLAFIQFLSEKLRWTTLFSHTFAQYDTAGRLLQLLIHYKEIFGRELEAGKSYEIDLSLTQADLASMVGAKREWINRLLRKWREKGLVQYDRGKILFLDFPGVVAEKNRRIAAFDNEVW